MNMSLSRLWTEYSPWTSPWTVYWIYADNQPEGIVKWGHLLSLILLTRLVMLMAVVVNLLIQNFSVQLLFLFSKGMMYVQL